MNFWRKVEEVIKPWMMVLAFLVILLFGFYKESKAEEVVNVELGGTMLSGEFSNAAAMVLNTTWNDRWRIGMGLTSEQEVTDRSGDFYKVRSNLFVHGQRLVSITENLDFGLGVGYFNAKTRWNGSNFVASMSVEYDFNEKWSVKYRHWSNAGSSTPNMGQDALLIGYSFR